MDLRKTVDSGHGVYRIFEVTPTAFLVLDEDGRTVDEFKIVDSAGGAKGLSIKRAAQSKRRRFGTPDLARSFAAELNAAHKRH